MLPTAPTTHLLQLDPHLLFSVVLLSFLLITHFSYLLCSLLAVSTPRLPCKFLEVYFFDLVLEFSDTFSTPGAAFDAQEAPSQC